MESQAVFQAKKYFLLNCHPAGVDEPHVVGDNDEAEADHVRQGVDVEGRLAAADGVGQQAGGQGAERQPQLGQAGHPAGLCDCGILNHSH